MGDYSGTALQRRVIYIKFTSLRRDPTGKVWTRGIGGWDRDCDIYILVLVCDCDIYNVGREEFM